MSSFPDMVLVDSEYNPFQIGRTQVTVFQYGVFLEETGWRIPQEWREPSENSTMPVSWVSHLDAIAYCFWLSQRLRQDYVLPSTGMIMNAGRSRENLILQEELGEASLVPFSKYPWGDEPETRLCNCAEFRPHRPGPVSTDYFGDEASSAFGIRDLSGNLWEMSNTIRVPDQLPIELDSVLMDPDKSPIDLLKFRGTWSITKAYFEDVVEKSAFAWNLRWDLVGGSYGTPVSGCVIEPTAWTSAANFGPYAGFRVAISLGQ